MHIGIGAGPAGPVLGGPLFQQFNEIHSRCSCCTTCASSASTHITNGIFCFSYEAQPAKVTEFSTEGKFFF